MPFPGEKKYISCFVVAFFFQSRVDVPERGDGGLHVGEQVPVGGLLADRVDELEDLALLGLLPVGDAAVAAGHGRVLDGLRPGGVGWGKETPEVVQSTPDMQ